MYQLHFENANPFNEFQDITLLWTTAKMRLGISEGLLLELI